MPGYRLAQHPVICLISFTVFTLSIVTVTLFLSKPPVLPFDEPLTECAKPIVYPALSWQERPLQTLDLSALTQHLQVYRSPPHPNQHSSESGLQLRLLGSGQDIPLTDLVIPLGFDEKNQLQRMNKKTLCWLDPNHKPRLFLRMTDREEPISQEVAIHCEVPTQKAEDFQPKTCWRNLAEAKWLGEDLVAQAMRAPATQRFEFAGNGCLITQQDWLYWHSGQWKKIEHLEHAGDAPVAHLRTKGGSCLEWEGWEGPCYVRIAATLTALPGSRQKVEELFQGVHIQSSAQLSCQIEKQHLFLRVGDWLIKEGARWKILRSTKERQQIFKGDKKGDLFVLEGIDLVKKNAKGKLILANRLQSIEVTLSGNSSPQSKRPTHNKGGGL